MPTATGSSGLSFHYIEPRFRFGLLDDALMKVIVEARQSLHDGLPDALKGAIELYAPETYNKSASLLDNVLFGRIGHQHADGAEKVGVIVRRVLDELGLSDDVFKIGLDFNVGVGGRRLTDRPAPEAPRRARPAEAGRHPRLQPPVFGPRRPRARKC